MVARNILLLAEEGNALHPYVIVITKSSTIFAIKVWNDFFDS